MTTQSPIAPADADPETTVTIDGYDLTVWPPGGSEPDGTPRHFNRWTFQNGLVRGHVEAAIHGRVLNACAGTTHLRHGFDEIHRNDLNPDRDADTHHDVETIDEHFAPGSFDAVVFDPPWSQEQADEHYDGMHARQAGPARQNLAALVRPGGTFVELGWNMFGPADVRDLKGWTRHEVNLYRRGQRPPAYLVVDRYPQATLAEARR